MDTALYLLPVTLGDTPIESVLPSYNKEIIQGIKHFIVEDVRSARLHCNCLCCCHFC